MGKERMALEIINNCGYNEFPDIVLSIRLAMAFAKKDFRNVDEAMRGCARACLQRAQNDHLRRTLLDMSKSATPTEQLTNLIVCNLKMRDELAHELKGKTIRQRDLDNLRKL